MKYIRAWTETLVFIKLNHTEWFRQARRGNTGWQAIKYCK